MLNQQELDKWCAEMVKDLHPSTGIDTRIGAVRRRLDDVRLLMRLLNPGPKYEQVRRVRVVLTEWENQLTD